MTEINEIPLITVPVAHFGQNNVITEEDVSFKIYRKDNSFRALPLISRGERLMTGLPEELEFVYIDYCIVRANDMEEETLNAIKQIILELEVQGHFDKTKYTI